MDWNEVLTHTVSAVVGAATVIAMGFGSYYFWFRNKLKKANTEERADAVQEWRQLMEYKSDDFRKKNQEQDVRAAAMRLEMDKMHSAHLACERAGMERELSYRREAAEREILLKRHEANIEDLSHQIDVLRLQIIELRKQQVIITDQAAVQRSVVDEVTARQEKTIPS